LIILFLLCFIPLGCEDDEVANSDTTVSAKSGYIYAPLEPEKDKNGMAIGLIALEQSVAPKDYQPVKNAYVSIGTSRSKTDEKGYFNISGLQPGEHEMLVSATGYIPVVQLTAVAGSSTATIAIDTMKIIPQEPLVIVNDMLQVTAVGKEMSGKFIPLNAITWSVFSEEDDKQDKASITNTGIFSATEAGVFKVIAASGTYNASTEVTVLSPADASTSTLTGEVTLSSGSPVEGATVIVSGTHLMTKTDEEGDYSILNVPADVSLTVFVIKNHTLIGSAPVSMEKWKEKSLDILASSDPPPVAEGEDDDFEMGQENQLTTGSLVGYVYIPADTEVKEEVKEEVSDDTNKETLVSITVSQSATVPDGYMALSGAKVIFENDPTIYSVTSTDGGFTLDNIPCKKDGEPYFVAVVMDGYVTTRVPVLFTGKYPTGIVTSIKIYPENPIVYLESSFEFKPVFYSREGEIIETSRVDWSVEGDVGTIDPNSGLFTPSRVGTGTVIVTYGDITERKKNQEAIRKAKEEAEKSDRLKSEFLAQMSHEIRSPINTILSFAGLIKEELYNSTPDEMKISFVGIENAGKRIIRTIDLILNMSEIQIGTYEPYYRQINIFKDVLEKLYLEFKTNASNKGLELNLINKVSYSEVYIIGDEYTIVQIFENLVNNAVKYTSKGFISIILDYHANKKDLIVEIKDSGIGISEEYLPSLFKPFGQEEQGYTRRYEGNGLGLALVKKYCEINKLDIEVESIKGKGSTFRVIFKEFSFKPMEKTYGEN